ncbi:hypothetical protein A3B85_03290 [Candidatus Nomurabacteria bacterium RIFCSPHIGHO2_02_FULL_37_13]|uniref:Small ribosomal subunit protein bS6 n=1 Tax=Candidatus Nomurabacteria bacterium RIFCSPHIGHO2_02_FULL_37_13 TaxID=1801750 RepID=A0A1F6W776_9BACT|nr:MAG: hypothetical protein A2640_00985 [Candidatus Nomurabacteria bacterium RIFCSPHIGHO2_01_FULL_36_23]OGI77759.1 MAG: hypothetical protein A3B85_03290 [Candidatus Nomurabacteria bacterium RIFCSPHIGHO2_02_FULL_37_13]OGI87690.1 MAG: hypothetical protein A2906_00320 [Candidatus Nomurabacteria bacterium RIFCSPLOWO2_01_FULL_37_25]
MESMQDAEKEVEQNANSRVYELGYLLVPTIKEEDIVISYGNLKELILSFGGEIVSDEMPKIISLAYTMRKVASNVRSKFNTAYFGWIKFTMNAQKVLELKKKIDLDPNFVRFFILKTAKENTIAAKRFVRGNMVHRKSPTIKRSGDNKEVISINKDEIDKEIDAMVAV